MKHAVAVVHDCILSVVVTRLAACALWLHNVIVLDNSAIAWECVATTSYIACFDVFIQPPVISVMTSTAENEM
jgi:Na+-transporting methylmalonyl-CoA/oxaloacetate decarboxylase beta subunit